MHTGESEERHGDYYGIDVNIAARIMSLGYGGQILLSKTTTNLVRESLPDECGLVDLGDHRLKGVASLQRIFQLTHPGLVTNFPPLNSLASYRHNLPRQSSTFIGRDDELVKVRELLEKNRLVTLLGPGGTGKTRLMLQVAEEVIEEFPDGVWLVELAPLADPELVPERVVGALKVQEQPGSSPLENLTEYLRRKELLLLLDNVEHLVQESAVLAEHLLNHCPRLKILVTGREALFIGGETTLQVPSLSLPGREESPSIESLRASEGVQLFISRGRAVRPDFELTEENAPAIAEIVRRLDGIPLALELAAARLRMLTSQQIAARLNDRFRLLTGGRRTALPRQQTLQALIDWSWNLLNEEERVLLRRLSVFSGGWTLEASQLVAGFEPLDEFDVFDDLEQLINKSLIIVQRTQQMEARYGMLESIHDYAQGKLIDAGEAETLRERHTAFFMTLVDEYDKQGLGPEYYNWQERLALEGDNLRAVMDWIAEDDPGSALYFAGSILQFDASWMPYREARSWLEPTLQEAKKLLNDDSAGIRMTDYIRALRAFGWQLVTHGDMEDGLACLHESARLASEFDEFSSQAFALGMLAQAMGTNVSWDVIEQVTEAIAVSRQDGHEIELLFLLFSAGQAYHGRNIPDKGNEFLKEFIHMVERVDIPFLQAWMQGARAQMALAEGNLAAAEENLLLAADTLDRLGDQRMAVTDRSMLAHLYRSEGRYDEALALYRQTILAWQEQGHQAAVAHQLECFAYIAIEYRRFEQAAKLLGAAHQARRRHNAYSTDLQEVNDLDLAMAQLVAKLGTDKRNRLTREGESMSLDEAVSFALQEHYFVPDPRI
jgi:predicted ATPase